MNTNKISVVRYHFLNLTFFSYNIFKLEEILKNMKDMVSKFEFNTL